VIIWWGILAVVVEEQKVMHILAENPEGLRLLGSPRSRWKDNININIEYCGLEC
jgi:hypothetical protein